MTCCQARQARVEARRGRAAYAACSTLPHPAQLAAPYYAYIDGVLKRLSQRTTVSKFKLFDLRTLRWNPSRIIVDSDSGQASMSY